MPPKRKRTASVASAQALADVEREEALVQRVSDSVRAGLREDMVELLQLQQQDHTEDIVPEPETLIEAMDVQGGSSDDDSCVEDMTIAPQHTPLSLPLGVSVDIKIKKKIWSNKFISLKTLSSNQTKSHFSFKLQSGNVPTVAVANDQEDTRPMSREAWTQNFYIFTAILCEKTPSAAPALMKYGFTINELAARGRDWQYYDDQFRRSYHGQEVVPWGQINTELYLQSDKPKQTVFQSYSRQNKNVSHSPSLVCFYARDHQGVCNRKMCTFRHTCVSCHGNHPTNRCRRQVQRSQSAAGKLLNSGQNVQHDAIKQPGQNFRRNTSNSR